MREFFKIRKVIGFEKVDMKGFGRWFVAGAILGGIASRMNIQSSQEVVNGGMSNSFISFVICYGIYGMVYNTLSNRPGFTRELSYTSRQEINMRIILFVQYIVTFAVLFAIYIMFVGFIIGGFTDVHIKAGYAIRYSVFSLFYYLIMAALMFPLGIIRDKKKWYLTFTGIAIVMATISLVFINLLPGNEGFRTSGMVFENIAMIDNCDVILGIMGMISMAILCASYKIMQKMHEPKRYE